MYQRTWSCPVPETSPPRPHAKPRVLIEDPSPVVELSDFSLFREAGFEVALCGGPDGSATCSLAEGKCCPLAEAADVVLFALDLDGAAGQSVLRAHARDHPERPVVVQLPGGGEARPADGAANCTVLRSPASVGGQTSALWKVLHRSGWGGARGRP